MTNCCHRCDKLFEPGEHVCVVTFSHTTYGSDQEPKPSDSSYLCEDCEDVISDTWPWEE